MDWFEPIAAYCERGDASFWAEPLNAASNAAFLVAAVAAGLRARAARDPACLALAILTGVVGLGSFLFHTLAVRWSMLADVVPIALFIHAYFWLAMARFLGLGALTATAATLAFAALGSGLAPVLDGLTGWSSAERTNGSIDYLLAILALAAVAALLPWAPGPSEARRATARRLVGIAALFAVSLVLRTADRSVCLRWPLGTHCLWHVLNAGVLYGLIAAALRHRFRLAQSA